MAEETFDETENAQAAKAGGLAAIRFFLPEIKLRQGAFVVALLLLVVSVGLGLWWPGLVQQAIDGPIAERDTNGLIYFGLGIILLQAGSLLTTYLMRLQLEKVGQEVMVSLKRQLFDHLLILDLGFFDTHPVGRLMARVESDSEALRLFITNTVVVVLGDVLLLAGLYSYMIYTNWKAGLVQLAVFPVVLILLLIYARITNPRYLIVRKKMAALTGAISEFISGMSIVQIFHRGNYARERVRQLNHSKFQDDAFIHIGSTLFFNVLSFTEVTKVALLLMFGQAFGMTTGEIVLFLVLTWRSFEPIHRASEQLTSFQRGMAGAQRMKELIQTSPKVFDPIEPKPWSGLRSEIRFDGVSFSYFHDHRHALRHGSFTMPRGSRTALVGMTGGGKSTCISLLLRYYDPQEGRILVDGIDIRDLSRNNLRSKIALVLQDIILFPGDIRYNIGLGNPLITPEKIEASAKLVAAHDFIMRLPKGYETEVSERGANFSRGERQLLSFARALAVDPEILILDEATSSVDPETERSIQKAMSTLMTGRTSLVVAHRLSTILDAEQILVFRQGEIIERGTHAELIVQNGYYARLFHLQYKHAATEVSHAS